MDYLSWDLAILSRAVAYNNLSGASAHVGLSQPQLSRIVAKLEDQLKVTLLDRETKRKSSWTPAAFHLAEIYTKTYQQFKTDVQQLVEGLEPDHLRIGTLEGLIPQAIAFSRSLIEKTDIQIVELNVYDTNVLEEKFFKNDVDLIFSAREPGRKKFRFVKAIGFQTLDRLETGDLTVYSGFEYASQLHKGPSKERAFVSNSLRIRKTWIDEIGGTGTVPSTLRPRKTGKKNEVAAMAIAHDHLPTNFWKKISVLI